MADFKKGDNKAKAKSSLELTETGLTPDNCEIVFELGKQLKSFRPEEEVRSLTKITKGKEYLIRLKEDTTVEGF